MEVNIESMFSQLNLVLSDFRLVLFCREQCCLVTVVKVLADVDQMCHRVLQRCECVGRHLVVDGFVDSDDGCVNCRKRTVEMEYIY